jgi:hypothetical protein
LETHFFFIALADLLHLELILHHLLDVFLLAELDLLQLSLFFLKHG